MSTFDSAQWLVQRRLWLVPRAETTWEASGRLAGHDERPLLTARGMHQARRYARVLAGAPVARVIVADLRPDIQTARPIARALGAAVTVEPQLRGRSFGVADGAPCGSMASGTGVEDGVVVDADAAPPGGESVRDVYRRVSRFVAELLGGELDGDVVLVADRDAIGVALAWLDGAGPGRMPWPAVRDELIVGRSVPVRVPLSVSVDGGVVLVDPAPVPVDTGLVPAGAVPSIPAVPPAPVAASVASEAAAAPTLSYA